MRRIIVIRSLLNDCRNPQFGCAGLLISLTEEVRCILPSRLSQFVELHLLLPKPLHALLYRFSDCAHHPAGLVIFAQLALLSLFIILIFPIFPIVGTCKITQTISDSNQQLLKRRFGLSGRQSREFSVRHIVLLWLNRCLCVFNSLSCPSGLSFNLILNPFLFLFIAYEVRFLSFLHRKPFFGYQAAQCPKGSDSLCLEDVLSFIRLMTSLGWALCWFPISASGKWGKVLFQSIDHCSLRGLCC